MRLLVGAGLSFALAFLVGGVDSRRSAAQTAPARAAGTTAAAPEAAAPLYGITGPPPAGLVRVDLGSLGRVPGWRIPLDGHSFG